jgi:hypothetical protein
LYLDQRLTVIFNEEDPTAAVTEMTRGIGVGRAIDAVGIDAYQPQSGPAAKAVQVIAGELKSGSKEVAPEAEPKGDRAGVSEGASPKRR